MYLCIMQKIRNIKFVVVLVSFGIILIISIILLIIERHRQNDRRVNLEDYTLLMELHCNLLEASVGDSIVHFVTMLSEDEHINNDLEAYNSDEEYFSFEQLPISDSVLVILEAFEFEKNVKLLAYSSLDNVLQECGNSSRPYLYLYDGGVRPIVLGIQRSSVAISRGMIMLWGVLAGVVLMVLFAVFVIVRDDAIIKRREDYVNFMAHEMKTPIAAMGLIGQSFVDDEVEKDEEWVKTFGTLLMAENEKLKDFVEEMLRYARGKDTLNLIKKDLVDLHAIILEGVKEFEKKIEDRQGCLKVDLSAERSLVMGDAFHLLNVIMNLVGNAVKYQDQTPWVGVESYNEGDNIVVRVMDKGKGIPKSEQKKVFEKFYRVKNAQTRISSHGLGLYYVKNVIKKHHGDIKIMNLENFGTVFVFILPIAKRNQKEPKSYKPKNQER